MLWCNEFSANFAVKVIEDQSRSCVYDSFSEDTGEESLDMGDTTAEEEAARKLEHAKRQSLQDPTLPSPARCRARAPGRRRTQGQGVGVTGADGPPGMHTRALGRACVVL